MSEDQGNVGFSLSRAAGGDDRRDPVPVHLCGGSLQTLPITQSVLGGVFTVVGHAAAHHEPPEPLLSAPAERLRDPIARRRDAEHHTHTRKRNVIETHLLGVRLRSCERRRIVQCCSNKKTSLIYVSLQHRTSQ